MPATFSDEECYQLFIAMDDRARAFQGALPEVNAIREKLVPFYRAWHDEHPGKVHPTSFSAVEARSR